MKNFTTLVSGKKYKKINGETANIIDNPDFPHDSMYPFKDIISGSVYCSNGNFYIEDHDNECDRDIVTCLEEDKTFPCKMLVWDEDEDSATQEIVIAYDSTKLKPYLVDFNNAGPRWNTSSYTNAKDIPSKEKLTIEEAEEKFNIKIIG